MRDFCNLIAQCLQSAANPLDLVVMSALSTRSIAQHLDEVFAQVTPTSTFEVRVDSTIAGKVLATDVTAQLPIPAFSHSAMDGFLVHRDDLVELPVTLDVVADIPAGAPPRQVAPGQAARIMTGAPVGDPVDAGLRVVPVENTNVPPGPQPLPHRVTITQAQPDRPHIRMMSDNVAPGELIARAGTLIDAPIIASLLSTGIQNVTVYAPLRIAVISSGDELVAFDNQNADGPPQLADGQIPDSNRPMLAALAAQFGGPRATVQQVHALDEPQALKSVLKELSNNVDIIITAGGVSAGAFDVVRAAATSLGSVWFGDVNQKPGAPQGLGSVGNTPLLCLPGNPVAAFVSFHLYVAPALARMRGIDSVAGFDQRPHMEVEAGENFPAPRDRDVVVPARLEYVAGVAQAMPFNSTHMGSHQIASLSGVQGFVVISSGSQPPQAGDRVAFYPLNIYF